MINEDNIGDICDFVGERLLGYNLGWTREGELVTTNLEGRAVFMRENHLKNLLRNDILSEYGQIDTNNEINRLIDIIISNCKKIARTKKEGSNKEVYGYLRTEKLC